MDASAWRMAAAGTVPWRGLWVGSATTALLVTLSWQRRGHTWHKSHSCPYTRDNLQSSPSFSSASQSPTTKCSCQTRATRPSWSLRPSSLDSGHCIRSRELVVFTYSSGGRKGTLNEGEERGPIVGDSEKTGQGLMKCWQGFASVAFLPQQYTSNVPCSWTRRPALIYSGTKLVVEVCRIHCRSARDWLE